MMMRRPLCLGVLLTVGLAAAIARTGEPDAASQTRPAAWAQKLERPGLPNLHKVGPGLYRGAQPTAEGIAELERLGVKTIVCLRANHSDQELLGNSKIALEHIPMKTWEPKEEDVVRFLRIAVDKKRQPVFVHCQHGADRTGTMCAVYRIAVEGWTKQQAIDEMTKGGYNFHAVWTNLPKFIEKLDVAKVRVKAGLEKSQ